MNRPTVAERLKAQLKGEPYAKGNLLLEDALKRIEYLESVLKKHAPQALGDEGGDGGTVDPPEEPPAPPPTPNEPPDGDPGSQDGT